MRAKIFIGLSTAFLGLLLVTASLSQGVPQFINYQGRLTDSFGQPLDGETVDLTFAFYGVQSGGTVYLSVLQEDVLVTAGLYHVLIGSGTIIPGTESILANVFQKHEDVWMGVKVDSDPEMTPRARITSVPYAVKAMKVDTAWLSYFTRSNDFDNDGYPKNNDCDDGDALAGPPSWQKLGSDLRATSAAGGSHYSSLSWTGSEFGVSWQDDRVGNDEIYFARISADGATIGSDLRITSAAGTSNRPTLSWTGSEFGVSWYDYRDGNAEIYFTRVSASGDTIGLDLRITSAPNDSGDQSLAWTGSEYGVSWHDWRDGNWEIYFVRISVDGIKIGSDLRITNSLMDSVYPSLIWNGYEFGVSWYDARDLNDEIYFARISADASKLGPDLRVTNDPNGSGFPSLSWTGSEFGVSWNDNRDGNDEIYIARISATGSKLGPDLRITSAAGISSQTSFSWTGSEFGLSWEDDREGNQEIYFNRISATGSKLGPDFRITISIGVSGYPSLAWTGSEIGASWHDDRDGNNEIYFARISPVCP